MAAANGLTKDERSLFVVYETAIHQGLDTFVEVGNALAGIRDKRLYRDEYGTFEAYCKDRWNLTKQHAHRLMNAAEAAETIQESNRAVTPPAFEMHVRPITRLPKEQQADAWQEAVNTAPEGKVTAKHVAEVVERKLDAMVPVLPRNMSDESPKQKPFDMDSFLQRSTSAIHKLASECPVECQPAFAKLLRTLAKQFSQECA